MKAETSVPVHEIIATRRSPRSFDTTATISDADLVGWAKNSSALILVAGKTTKRDGSIHADFQYDCGLAVAQLVIEAHHRGLIAHQMTGFDKAIAQSELSITADLMPVVVIALGTQDAPEKLSGPLLEREIAKRERLPLSEIVVKGLPA